MNTDREIDLLWDSIRRLEDRVRELEDYSGVEAIGFDLDFDDDFDEDDPED